VWVAEKTVIVYNVVKAAVQSNALSSMLYPGLKQCLFVMLVGGIVRVRDLLRENETMANRKETTSKVNTTMESERETNTKEGCEALCADKRPQVFGQHLLWPCRLLTIPQVG
jgi:hypothetical protein